MNEALWVRLIGRGENHLALSQDGLGLTEVSRSYRPPVSVSRHSRMVSRLNSPEVSCHGCEISFTAGAEPGCSLPHNSLS